MSAADFLGVLAESLVYMYIPSLKNLGLAELFTCGQHCSQLFSTLSLGRRESNRVCFLILSTVLKALFIVKSVIFCRVGFIFGYAEHPRHLSTGIRDCMVLRVCVGPPLVTLSA